jgi:hypothetical protein
MEISKPNKLGVLMDKHQEVVARHGKSYAAVNIALCEDGQYRQCVELQFSQGGYSGPITVDDPPYPTFEAAKIAGVQELLKRWDAPFPGLRYTVQEELRDMRRQVEDQVRQPGLF